MHQTGLPNTRTGTGSESDTHSTDTRADSARSRFPLRLPLYAHSPLVAYPLALAIGVILGASGPLLLATDAPFGQVAHLTLSAGWSWAALAYFVGMAGGSKMRSAATGTLALMSAVCVYYATKAQQGAYLAADLSDPTGQATQFDWDGFISKTLLWCVFALFLGPLLGAAGNLARNSAYRFPCRLVIPLVVIVETTMRLGAEADLQGSLTTTTWSATRAVAIAALIAVAVLAALDSRRRRRPGA